jgi:hypothetical protein
METDRHSQERCETCRFWQGQTHECHRHAPVILTPLGRTSALSRVKASQAESAAIPVADRAWPRTEPDEWCGEWDGPSEKAVVEDAVLPIGQIIATQTFLGKFAPTLETRDPAALLAALLNQLSPDIRRVIVRMNGLDGQPLSGLKDVAREFRMSREQVRALVATGEKRLAEVVAQLIPRRSES